MAYPEPIDAVQIDLRLEVFRAEKCGKLPDDRVHVAGLIAEGVASALRGAMASDTEAYKSGLVRAAVICLRALEKLEKGGA